MARNTVIVSVLADTKQFAKGFKETDSLLGSLGKTAAKTIGGIGLAIGGLAMGGGFARALKMDEAKTQLDALGYSAGEVTGIMDSALKSVKGTAFGLDSAATIAANALASGIKPGDDLTKSLTLVANTAALAKTDMGDMGGVFQKVWARGKVTTREMNQLADRGVPIWQYLSESFGVSNEELQKMITAGEVTADMFESALGPAVEGMATKMSSSFKGMAANSMAALSRVGAMFAGPMLDAAKGFLGEFTILTDGIGERLKPLADKFSNFLGGVSFEGFADKLLSGFDKISAQGVSGLVAGLSSAIAGAAAWIADGGTLPLVRSFTEGRANMLDAGMKVFGAIADALPQILPALADAALMLVQDLVSIVASSGPAILRAGVEMFSSLLRAVGQILPPLLASLVAMLPSMVATLLDMVAPILDAATLLFTSLVEAIPVILPVLIAAIVDLLPNLVESILGMLPGILDSAIELFTALVESIPIILPVLINAIFALLPELISTLLNMLPKLLEGAVKLFTGIVTAIPKILPELIPALLRLGPEIIKTLIELVPTLIRAGIDLIGGLVKGLVQAAGSVGSALINIAKNAIGGFLNFLGIKSPSRLFAGFGTNVVQGLVNGLNGGSSLVDRAMDSLSSAVSGGFDAALDAGEIRIAVAGSGSRSMAGNRYDITVQAIAPNAEVGRAVVDAIRDFERVGGAR